MKYTPTPGVVMTKICGQNVLIPTRAAYDRCKSVQILPTFLAGTYEMIQKGNSMEEILKIHRIFKRKKTDEQILSEIEDFCETLCAKGFLIRTDEPSPPAVGADIRPEAENQPASSAAPTSPAEAPAP